MPQNRDLSVGEVAKRSGLAVSAIHFYESKGLIKSQRNRGNQRRYSSGVLRYLSIIKVAQRVGITLEEIKDVLGVYSYGMKMTSSQWEESAAVWRELLNERIKTLSRLRDEIDGCIGCGCLSLTDCPLRNPDDVLAEKGPGAHILNRP